MKVSKVVTVFMLIAAMSIPAAGAALKRAAGQASWKTYSPYASPTSPGYRAVGKADWKTYRNDKFGFEFKYPPEFNAVSTGPNDVQKEMERGEMVSGTVPPSFDTINFLDSTDSTNKKLFDVTIFPVRDDPISPGGFNDGYLDYGSACDRRWIDSISEKPRLIKENGISVLEVQVISEDYSGCYFEKSGCYYFKNSKGNLVVFNIPGYRNSCDFFKIFSFAGDEILPTLSLIK